MAMIKEIRITVAKEIGSSSRKSGYRLRSNLMRTDSESAFTVTRSAGVIWPDMVLAVDADETGIRLEGVKTRSPSGKSRRFGLKNGIVKRQKFMFRLLDPRRVVAEHLKSTVTRCAAELLTRDAVAKLLEGSCRAPESCRRSRSVCSENWRSSGGSASSPSRTGSDSAIGSDPRVPGDEAPRNRSPIYLTEQVRGRLARTLCGQYRNEDGELFCVDARPELEEKVASGSDLSHEKVRLNLAPSESNEILGILSEQLEKRAPLSHFFSGSVGWRCDPSLRDVL